MTALELIWPDLLLFVFLFALLFYVLAFNRISKTHKVYLAFHIIIMMWPFGQFMISATGYPEFQLAFAKLSFSSISLVGLGWLYFVFFLTRKTHLITGYKSLIWPIPALLCLISVLWNPAGLFMSPVGGSYLTREYGPLFWFLVIVQFAYILSALLIMFQALKTVHSIHHRKQLAIAVVGIFVLTGFCALDLLANVLLAEWLPIIPGLMSTGILLSVCCFVISINRYGMFDALSMAQRDIFSHMSMGIIVTDEQSRVLEVNQAASPFVSANKGEIFDMAKYLGLHLSQEETKDFLYKFKNHPEERIQTEIALSGSPVRYASIQVSPILDCRNTFIGRIITFHDVTDLRQLVDEMNSKNEALHERNLQLITIQEELFQLNQKLEQMAITDGLTGCYNRRYLMQQLEHEVLLSMRYRIPFSVFLFDIDHFKQVNDRYGHLVGDEVIKSTANVVRENLRRTDILARYGGEEFTVYLPYTNREQAELLAHRLKTAVSQNCVVAGSEEIRVTISMGVVTESGEQLNLDNPQAYLREVFARADAALYEAKTSGRNQGVMAH